MTRLIPAVVLTLPGLVVPLLACTVWWAATPLWPFQKYDLHTPYFYYPCTYLFCLIRFSVILWNCCARSKATSSMSSGMLARRAHSIPNDSRLSPAQSSSTQVVHLPVVIPFFTLYRNVISRLPPNRMSEVYPMCIFSISVGYFLSISAAMTG